MSLGNDQKLCVKLIKEFADGEKNEQGIRSDSEEADDDSKIKPEVELKETTDDFVYKADFRGHLQLVSAADVSNNHCRGVEASKAGEELTKMTSVEVVYNSPRKQDLFSKKDDDRINVEHCNRYELSGEQEQWSPMKSVLPNSEDVQEIIVTWEEPLQHSDNNLIYAHVKNIPKDSVEDYYIKEESPENLSQQCNFGQSLPEIYDYSEIEISDSSWEQPFAESSQLHKNAMRNKNMILLTQAEKKRLYRMRMKEENPAMWSNIKKREAARKREQREKRRHILFEMQRAMECADMPDSPDVMNHKLYLEALKERYPELWNQLINALPATQDRNEQLFNDRKSKSRRLMPKPAKMYKDVIEAQKKRLYRQRIKEERPEMYARQKARDAYARSVQRLMLKKQGATQKNRINIESFSVHPNEMERKLTHLQNLKMDHVYYMETDRRNSPFTKIMTSDHVAMSEVAPTPSTKSEPSQVCDNDCSEDSFDISKNSLNTSDSNVSNADKMKELCEVSETAFSKTLSGACSTQSDILWYWNGTQFTENISVEPRVPYAPWRKRPQVLSEEERFQKILKERMQLKEKRRKYRLNMSPEKRNEFLEIERERLKAYRLKKKAAALLSLENGVKNEIMCVEQ